MRRAGEFLRQAESVVKAEFERELGQEFAQAVPIFKFPNQAMGAAVSFNHRGPAETVTVIWSIAPGSVVPGVHQEDQSRWVQLTSGSVPVSADIDLINYAIALTGRWPTTLPAAGLGFSWSSVDCRVEVFRGSTSILMRWFDDIYLTVVQEYRDLEATFT